MSALYEVTLPDGRRWIGSTANHASAVRCALAEVYGDETPARLALTVERLDGGAVVVPTPDEQ